MLKLVKTLHTIIWAIMVSAIFYILYCGITNTFNLLLWLCIALIIFEAVVLIRYRGCPFTPMAEKYTSDKSDNRDIYLPNWLAKNNKYIFSTLFFIGLAIVIFDLIRNALH